MLPLIVVIALLIFWVCLIYLRAFIHFFMINIMKRRPNYLVWGIIRGTVGLLYALIYNMTGIEWYPLFGFMLGSDFVLFNPVLNKLRYIHNPAGETTFWYLGKNSGWFDKMFLENKLLHRICYYLSFILMCLCFFTLIEFYV